MESISAIEVEKRLVEASLRVVTATEIERLLGIEKKNTTYKLIMRLEKYGLLVRLAKGIYGVKDANVSDFEAANYLAQPSYVSLESALTYYGILSQFTYSITSITTVKSKKVISRGKEFEYTRISNQLYWGYEKKDGALLAYPEKAFLDMAYMASKGWRKIDVKELDISGLDKARLREFESRFDYAPFRKLMKGIIL